MNFLREHLAALPAYLGYHARTLLRRRHRADRLAVVSGEGRVTAVLLGANGRLLAVSEDFGAVLDPPLPAASIRGEQASRIKSVPPEERTSGPDSFRRKFLDAAGLRGATARGALILDRPRATAALDVYAGKRGESLNLAPGTILEQIIRNPRERLESWSNDPKQAWRWHLTLRNLDAPQPDDSQSSYLAFGVLETDVTELEGWAENTRQVEWDLCANGQHAALRFFAENFFRPGQPCLAVRVYPPAGPEGSVPAADPLALMFAWDGSQIQQITGAQPLSGLAERATRLHRILGAAGGAHAGSTVPLYVLAPPSVTLPPAPFGFELLVLRKDYLAGPDSPLRHSRPQLADLLGADLPGTPEMVLALWAAVRLSVAPAALHAGDEPTPRFQTPAYREQQVRRVAPAMRRGAALAWALVAALILAVPVDGWLWWRQKQALEVRDLAAADARRKTTDLDAFGETVLRLEDLQAWRPHAERWPLTALLARLPERLPDSLALREVGARALTDAAGVPRGYELRVSGFSRPDTRPVRDVLGEVVFPGATVRDLPPEVSPAATMPEAAPDPSLTPWRVVVTLDFARLRPADYPVESTEPGAAAAAVVAAP